MDSMRSLNTSLPRTSPPKQQMGDPPEQLLQAFKAAALSVTTLYKTAATDQSKARTEGYQDALDELLVFLDKEDIGLSDGEGWRVRRWATERLDGRDSVSQNPESDDEAPEKAERGSSPVLQRSQSATRLQPNQQASRAMSPVRTEPTAQLVVPAQDPVDTPPISAPQQNDFTFRSSHPYPQDADTILSDLDISGSARRQSHDAAPQGPNPPGITITLPPRTNPRHGNHSTRTSTRSQNTIGRGAGQKRKINIGEFFDIGNLGHGRDGFGGGGGGKRGRFT